MEKRIEVFTVTRRRPIAVVTSVEAALAVSRLYREWVSIQVTLGERQSTRGAYGGKLFGGAFYL